MTEHEMVQQLLRIKDQAPVVVDAEKSALVVVDVQRFFARPEYPFAQAFEKMVPGVTADYFRRVNATVLPNIQHLLACFRARKLPIIYFAVGCHSPDGRDLPGWMREFDEVDDAQRPARLPGDPIYRIDSERSSSVVCVTGCSSPPVAGTRSTACGSTSRRQTGRWSRQRSAST